MAKGVAAMTMDEEYQQKRREAMNKQPSGLREGLTRGGKGLVSVSEQLSKSNFAFAVKLFGLCVKSVCKYDLFHTGFCKWHHGHCD